MIGGGTGNQGSIPGRGIEAGAPACGGGQLSFGGCVIRSSLEAMVEDEDV